MNYRYVRWTVNGEYNSFFRCHVEEDPESITITSYDRKGDIFQIDTARKKDIESFHNFPHREDYGQEKVAPY